MSSLEHLRKLTSEVETAGRRALSVERTQAEAERQLAEAHDALRSLHAELTRKQHPGRNEASPSATVTRDSPPDLGSDIAEARQAITLARGAGLAATTRGTADEADMAGAPPRRKRRPLTRTALLLLAGMCVSGAALALLGGNDQAEQPVASISASGSAAEVAEGPVRTVAASYEAELAPGHSQTSRRQSAPAASEIASGSPYAKRFANAGAAERECLAQAVYYEARGEPVAGQMAVAQVILNRAMAGNTWPDTICGVVREGQERGEKCQFSFACMRGGLTKPHGEAWQQSSWVASEVLNGGAFLDELGSATHYHRADLTPAWRLGLKAIGRIGLHVFYGSAGSKHILDLEVAGDGGAGQRVPFADAPTSAAGSIVRKRDIGRGAGASARRHRDGNESAVGTDWLGQVNGR